MQPDAPVVHTQKSHCQYQGNGYAHHQARTHVYVIALVPAGVAGPLVKPQCDKTDRQNDHDGFHQRSHKLVDRLRHGGGLVLHLHQTQAHRQRRIDVGGGRLERLAKGDDVAPLGHGNAQADHLFTLKVHLHARRVNHAALDLGDIAQVELVA